MPSIPTIDISAYLDAHASDEAKARVTAEVTAACAHYGFLQIIRHGVPRDLQREVMEASVKFFGLDQKVKEGLSLRNNCARRGYDGFGEQLLDPRGLPDWKESFFLGREVPLEKASFLLGPNQWPDLPEEVFRKPIMEYFDQMDVLGRSLLEMLAIGLGHDVSVLESFTTDAVKVLRLLHYPPTPPPPSTTAMDGSGCRQFGAAAHTDFGALTVLMQQPERPGLQVYYAPTEEWVDVPAVEGVFVVNIGDLVEKWSEGKFKSTRHRVINESDGHRYSVPCFYHGDLNATNPFASTPGADGQTVGEYVKSRYEQSFGGFKAK